MWSSNSCGCTRLTSAQASTSFSCAVVNMFLDRSSVPSFACNSQLSLLLTFLYFASAVFGLIVIFVNLSSSMVFSLKYRADPRPLSSPRVVALETAV